MALAADAGDLLQASPLSFPVETATTIPAATIRSTAALTLEEKSPPRLMLATDFCPGLLTCC